MPHRRAQSGFTLIELPAVRRRQVKGFTLIELLVAISLAALMIGLINLIFNEVSNAVSRGIATSRIINNSRAVGEQMSRDGKGMVGPGGGGVLIILNQQLSDMPMLDARYGGEIGTTNSGLYPTAPIRSDQLLFFYDNQGTPPADVLNGIAPGSPTSFAPNSAATNSRYARIWYGHALRTYRGENGAPPPSPTVEQLGSGPNRWADRWILSRHALFLFDSSPGLIYARHAVHNAVVTYGGTVNGSIPLQLNWALTDVADFSFDTNGASTSTFGYLIGDPLPGNTVVDGWLDDSDTAANYKANAYALTFGANRMRTNPQPEGNTFLASQIAQMHPYFMGGVSDFIVQFAADAEDDGNDDVIDNTPDVNASGDIVWYDAANPPTYDMTGTYAGLQDPVDPAPGLTHADAAFLWRHHEPDTWPYMIRIRYRLHDPNGELTSVNEYRITTNGGTAEGIDNDGNGVTDDESDAIEVGKWFEVIIPVNRS